MSRRSIKIARKIKGKTLLKRTSNGLERENKVYPRMNQIAIVRKIHHQRTQILTMADHQNLQRKKCSRMSIPHQGSLPSLQWKRINGNLASNWKSGPEANFWNAFLTRKSKRIIQYQEISFLDKNLMTKAQENLTNIMGPLARPWAHLDHLKKGNGDNSTAGDHILGCK